MLKSQMNWRDTNMAIWELRLLLKQNWSGRSQGKLTSVERAGAVLGYVGTLNFSL